MLGDEGGIKMSQDIADVMVEHFRLNNLHLDSFMQRYAYIKQNLDSCQSRDEIEAIGKELLPLMPLVESARKVEIAIIPDPRIKSIGSLINKYYAKRRVFGKKPSKNTIPSKETRIKADKTPLEAQIKKDEGENLNEAAKGPESAGQKEYLENLIIQNLNGHIDIDNQSYMIAREYVRMVAHKNAYAATLLGEGGLGKTHLIMHELAKGNFNYCFYNGKITPATLYEFLARNNNPDQIIIFDDVRSLIDNEDMINMLKGALWENDGKTRSIRYNSKFPLDEGIPKKIDFKGRMIFTFNKIKKDDPDVDALISRTLYTEIYLNYEEKVKAMYEIAKAGYKSMKHSMQPEECRRVTDFIVENSDDSSERFNFRMQRQIFDFYTHCSEVYGSENKVWEELAKASLKNGNGRR